MAFITKLYHWYLSWRNGAPYRGQCAWCHGKVFHNRPYWTKNPELFPDALPFHDECRWVTSCPEMIDGLPCSLPEWHHGEHQYMAPG